GCAAATSSGANLRARTRRHAKAAGEVAGEVAGWELPVVEPCTSNANCGADQFCEFDEQHCGLSSAQGRCSAVAEDCPGAAGATCGCDGHVYESLCAASTARVDVSVQPELCQAPQGSFRCGALFCRLGAEYCERWVAPGQSWTCRALPNVC